MKLLHWLLIVLGICGLIGVRMVESTLFYDPFLNYFRSADRHALFPNFEWFPLIRDYIFRFLLNVIFSALIIQFAFNNKRWTVQAVVLICLVFIITFPLYVYSIHTKFEIGYLFSFYMRRFVIQPLTLLLIIPLFYYRKRMMREII